MQRALRLAEKGRGWTLPNPMVGAVIIKDGRRIGEGFHEKYGENHAEINAIKNAQESVKGATLYVTLEPCCHHGKTPPCTDTIIESGISKVVIASKDPSKKVNGKGIKKLKEAGIKVEFGLLEENAETLNREFYIFHREKRPYITLKVAISLDAKVSKKRGIQTMLSNKKSQKQVHLLRHFNQGILVGAGTVLTDKPHLGVRIINGRDPVRIILKGDREINNEMDIFRDENYLLIENKDINEIIKILYNENIVSVLVEGGPSIFTAFLKAGLVDECIFFITPHILGKNALEFHELTHRISFSTKSVRKLGSDIMITTTPQWDSNNG